MEPLLLTSTAAAECCRRRCRELPRIRVAGGIERAIANRPALGVGELQRLLEQPRRRRARRNRGFENIETRPMTMDFRERAGSVGVRQLETMAFDLIHH